MQDIIDSLLKCQATWLYLEPIFSSEDIIAQMPEEGQKFAVVDSCWNNIITEAVRFTTQFSCCCLLKRMTCSSLCFLCIYSPRLKIRVCWWPQASLTCWNACRSPMCSSTTSKKASIPTWRRRGSIFQGFISHASSHACNDNFNCYNSRLLKS